MALQSAGTPGPPTTTSGAPRPCPAPRHDPSAAMTGQEVGMSAPAPTTVAGNPSSATMRRVVAASFVGNLVEWFDYAVYGYLATTLATVFFPETSQTAALLSTFAVFAVSFIVRPLGGIFWGRFGDRNGRRAALSISIIIMSCSTVVVAILPSYDQV